MTHDYRRHGTTDLFATLNVATGEVLYDCRTRHTGRDVLAFFKLIDLHARSLGDQLRVDARLERCQASFDLSTRFRDGASSSVDAWFAPTKPAPAGSRCPTTSTMSSSACSASAGWSGASGPAVLAGGRTQAVDALNRFPRPSLIRATFVPL